MRLSVLLLLFCVVGNAQKVKYTIAEIPKNLLDNANAVVRNQQVDINISSRRDLNIRIHRVVSVLNELGLKNVDAVEFRDVKSVEATLYDAFGNEIKKFRRKDFKSTPYSAGAIITDNIATYLEFTPTQYPFTLIYESVTGDSNTAFLPTWLPVDQSYVSVENSSVTLTCPADLKYKYKASHFGDHSIIKNDVKNGVSFTATNMAALRQEQYAPSLQNFMPVVHFGLENFHLEGVDGEAVSWQNLSSWMYNHLLSGTAELSDDTRAKIIALVGSEQDPVEKAKIIYQYVQAKTRYVSIQLGIGGWRPMKAKDVDRLGYGDCKALTNYTRALLEVVGVPSYYAVVYGSEEKRNLDTEFVSMQGNHVILAIPHNNEMIWLECTSQTQPFGFLGDFTDGRLALLVKPSDGTLVRTATYEARSNSQISTGSYKLDSSGDIAGTVDIRSRGVQYDSKAVLERKSAAELNQHYKEYFHFGNLKLNSTKVANNKSLPELTESVAVNATGYGSLMSNRIMFAVNAYNQYSSIPQRYKNRLAPLEIMRGFYDSDEITVDLPEGYVVEALPTNVSLQDKFGQYNAEFKMLAPNKMLYKRTMLINEGNYAAAEYESYRKFIEQIARAENSKMVLVKN